MKVIFISMDTLRADRLGCLGYLRGLTPNLDRIAGQGALFTQAFASDIPTQPSHTAIFTGRYGLNTSVVSHFHPATKLDPAIPWLPSIYGEKGYATGAVDHLFAMKDWFVRGYNDYMPPPGRSRAPGSVILDIAFPWLEQHRKKDFYLFLHFWDAHIPYVPPSPFKEKYTASSALYRDPLIMQRLRGRPSYPLFDRNLYSHLDDLPNLEYVADLYDAEVAYLDHEIGRLFQRLGDLGILDDALVVLFSDHGENMYEHDAWFDHAGLYDSVVRVPLILWSPNVVPPVEISSLVSLVDVQPTVLELTGMPVIEGVDGRSLVPLMQGSTATHRDVVYLSECTWQSKRGLRSSQWKFIRCTDPGVYPRNEDELYDIVHDPTEQRNVALENPEVVERMAGQLSAWIDEQLGDRPDPMLEVIATGLPAVTRLDSLINSSEAPDELAPEQPTEQLTFTPPLAPVHDVARITPSDASVFLAAEAGVDLQKKGSRRRRIVFVASTTAVALAILALVALFLTSQGSQFAGVIEPTSTVQLNFVQTAPIATLWVKPGQTAHQGEVLATQNAAVLLKKLSADQAKLSADQVLLADGPTPSETPQQLQSDAAQAQAAVSTAQTKASNQATLDQGDVSAASSQLQSDQATLASDEKAEAAACASNSASALAACQTAQHQVSVDQSNLTAAQNTYSEAQQSQRADASDSQSAIAQAESGLASAEANEEAKSQPQNQEEISNETAVVAADQAAIAEVKMEIANTGIVAPFTGIVATVNAATGDVAGPNGVKQITSQGGITQPSSGFELFPQTPSGSTGQQPQQEALITLQSRQTKIVVQVSQADIGQIHQGETASISLPAISGSDYEAKVTDIEPSPVTESGNIYYLVDLEFVRSSAHHSAAPTELEQLSGLSVNASFH
jgi:arylsulfatase A-like enzyme/multidrug efflux pump subunit AcrA (membrane-fusion protein)